MTFLPIVDRELRVSARRRATYWARVTIAFVSTVVGACIFLANFDEPEQNIGPHIFLGLSILGFCYCLLAGRLFTVSCLTDEKQEGTLGLLFLTSLKGHDVVLGKMAATSLSGFFSLLALLPVLAIPLLMGGTTSGQFWRMALVLVSTFLFSLALGIFASAFHRTTRLAAVSNLLLLLFLVIGIPLLAMALIYFVLAVFAPFHPSMIPWPLFYTSPVFAFVLAFDVRYVAQPAGFWCSVGLINTLTCLLVYRAGRVVPHSWQDRLTPLPKIAPARVLQRSVSFEEASKRAAHRKQLLDINAFYWLALRNRRKPMRVWWFLAFALVWWVWGWFSAGSYWFDAPVKITAALMVNIPLKLWVALEASHQLAEDKRSGALELLLSSPLTVRDIVRGQWLALRRQFLRPMLAVAALELLFLWTIPSGTPDYDHWRLFCFIAAGLLMLVADAVALGWVAMYQALAARSPAFAGSLTVTRVLVVPWVFVGVIATIISVNALMTNADLPSWKFYLALWLIVGLITDAVFGLTAWQKLQTNFRQIAAGRFSPAQSRPS